MRTLATRLSGHRGKPASLASKEREEALETEEQGPVRGRGEPGRRRHVLFLIENQPYPYDPRVRGQAAALLAAGYRVTVAAPTGERSESLEETIEGVRVRRYRAPAPGRGLGGYVLEYLLSSVQLQRILWRTHRREPVDAVFVCSPPDFLVLLALPLARRGAAVVFDNRELSPELFETKFRRQGTLHRCLLLAERLGFRHADVVLVTNGSYAANAHVRGGVDPERVFVVGNGPDRQRIFPVKPRPELRRGRDHLVLWMGAMSQQEGLELLIDAADELVNHRGRTDVTFALVGPGDVHDALKSEVVRRQLEGVVDLPGRVNDELVRAYLATADVCVGVDVRSPMNDRAAMRKVFEYMAMGRAVVQFPLPEMRRLCGDATAYARNGDSTQLAERIEELLDDPQQRQRLGEEAQLQLSRQELMWQDQVPSLLAAVDTAFHQASVRSRKR
ncbi:MAG: glycosyltransferase family 4 protein [Actinomycetota bacterium]|nr:glycosyltransferase family 4 protein [Actinomycetota bacterium]